MKRILLLLLAAASGLHFPAHAQNETSDSEFCFKIDFTHSSKDAWTADPDFPALKHLDYKCNLSRCYTFWGTPDNNKLKLGYAATATTSQVWNTAPFPSISKVVVNTACVGNFKITDITDIRLLVSEDPEFPENSVSYSPVKSEMNNHRHIFNIDNPVANAYYRLEYDVPKPNNYGQNYGYIQEILFYPGSTVPEPVFFESEEVRVISEEGELRIHSCYYDANWQPVAGCVDWDGSDLEDPENYVSYLQYTANNVLGQSNCVARFPLPAYSSEKAAAYGAEPAYAQNSESPESEAKYLKLWAQTYKNGELSDMLIRQYGTQGLMTGSGQISADITEGAESAIPAFYSLQGVRISNPETIPAGTIYITVNSRGAVKSIRR